MQTVATLCVLVAMVIAAYVYIGYYLILWVSAEGVRRTRRGSVQSVAGANAPTVSVIIAALNEERHIVERVEDLLAQDYPPDKMEIIVCSDGSTDKTVTLAKQFDDRRMKVLAFPERRGRGAVHNDGVKEAAGEVVVFTDAETRFSPDTLRRLTAPFEEPRVGCTVGHVISRGGEGGVARSEGAYWRYEYRIREVETRLGILATGTGACLAVRRALFRPLRGVADVDCVTPLDCIIQGYRVVYVPQAVAYDVPAATPRAEFRSRARMTSRNLKATLASWGPRQWLRHPWVTWGLLSHKILRWLCPFLLVIALAATLVLAFSSGVFAILLALQLAGYFLALVGGLAAWAGRSAPVASLAFSFVLSNLGMGVGVVRAALGKAPVTYGQPNRVEKGAKAWGGDPGPSPS
jgi:cellulose synthase/poly-beta-1,6-N-acetylglucosamine synthase-like glycosyltransferase